MSKLSDFEKSSLDRDIQEISDVRKVLLEMAFSYRRTARFYISMLTVVIVAVIILFLAVRHFGFSDNGATSDIPWSVAIVNATLHLGAVALVVYLAQLLIGFSRYHYKVADKLSSQANAVTICIASNDLDRLPMFINCMSLDIDFGKEPVTPTDKIIDAVTKLQGSNK